MTVLQAWSWKQQTFYNGRPGDPDPDIVPWCNRINALQGICTLQSCAGHRDNGNIVTRPGHLWLWMDRLTSKIFDASAFELARHRNVERVERLYTAWGQEIASITFAGNERDRLAESMQAILVFLHELEHQATCTRTSA